MIVKDEFLKKLRQVFDLNIYEVKIWTALLSRGISTAAELSDISAVPRSRSYDVLESLERKGFIMMKIGKPIKYIAVNPDEVVLRVKKSINKKAEERTNLLEKARSTKIFNDLQMLHKNGIALVEPSDLSGAIRGRENLHDHIETMLRDAKKSVTLVTSDKGLIRKTETLKYLLQKLSKKHVKIRIAAQITPDSMNSAKSLAEVADVRDIQHINARFLIVDREQILFMLLEDKQIHSTYDVGIWVKTPYFASALESMFDLTWNNLKKI